jgi:ABC-type microcin C transport system duplicated ATPase subunit YejF
MAATARLIVMMEQDEKAALEAQAEAANVSTAEFVRRRLFGRGEPGEQTFLEMLAALKPLVRNACKTIDANLAEIRALRTSADKRDAEAAKHARGELTRKELSAIADRMQWLPHRRSAGRRRRARA